MIMGTRVEVDLAEVQASVGSAVGEPTATIAASLYDLPLREARDRFERDYLLHQLQAVGGNVSKLAERVGMERTHLYRKMRALAIDPKQIG
jgi:DNA-binding NtrC family response regulator